ncbi:MAG: hypothetical protein DI533_20420 [Cereibacter sphaeroides]|uniref:Uncharacterized protein n=1 Tax=Cereibacter sphaeroides TaxID=1063 RepID=A0A2W5RWJ8_CERSP|nr:MAG: hypothetical protein DI533_20420 [Cereibacter sphaeroides]
MSCDTTLLKKYLQEAEAAYHQLMMGGSVRVFVDQNAERVEYTAANKANLYNYIITLRSQICALDPSDPMCACGIGVGKPPVGFTFR